MGRGIGRWSVPEMDILYRINDALTVLKNDLGIRFADEDAEDAALDEATFAVARAFGFEEAEPASGLAGMLDYIDTLEAAKFAASKKEGAGE